MLGAIEAGARGYLLKDAAAEGVGTAILQLLAGGSPITPAIAQHLILRFQEAAPMEARAPGPVLSQREREVFELVVKVHVPGDRQAARALPPGARPGLRQPELWPPAATAS